MNIRSILLTVPALILWIGTAAADPISYPSRATFVTSVSGALVEGWDAYPDGMVITSLNGVTYTPNSGQARVTNEFGYVSAPNSLGDTNTGGYFTEFERITFTFATPVTAFGVTLNTFSLVPGAYFAFTNRSDLVFSALDPFHESEFGQFIGFSSTTPITSVLIGATTGATSYTLDDLTYLPVEGTAPVPEPASMLLLGTGLVGIGVRGWRQRRAIMRDEQAMQ